MRVALAVVIVAGVGVARADEAHDRAAEVSRLAFIQVDDGKYKDATGMFLQAYELTKELPYLLNASVAARKGSLPHIAVATLRRYLADAGPSIDPAQKRQLEADIDVITRSAAVVTVTTPGEPVAVQLDSRDVGSVTHALPLVVLVGPEAGYVHSLLGHRDGQLDDVHQLGVVSAGQALEVGLDPKPRPTTAALSIETEPAHADLFEHERALGRAPQTVTLAPGDHEIVARLKGYEDKSERLTLEIGQPRELTIRLRALPEPSWWQRHKLLLALVGGGAVLAAGGGILLYEHEKPDYGLQIRH